jgi:hypothetical protein
MKLSEEISQDLWRINLEKRKIQAPVKPTIKRIQASVHSQQLARDRVLGRRNIGYTDVSLSILVGAFPTGDRSRK